MLIVVFAFTKDNVYGFTLFENYSSDQRVINGTVNDADGIPIIGVNIIIQGTQTGTQTDFDGNYVIAANVGDVLIFSYIGMTTQSITVGDQDRIDITMQQDDEALEEVVVVSFGTQKKSNVISSVSSIQPEELLIPSSNLTTMLSGRLPGLISYQRSGEPGADNAEFFVRGITSFGAGGNNPLILIDGAELSVNDLSRIHPDDIASFSILKDASATALYGARGANGVVYVTTKEGFEGPLQVSVRAEVSMSRPTDEVEIADPVIYMEMFNEAIRTRDPLEPVPFSQEKIDQTRLGTNPLLYPAVDWQEALFKNQTINSRVNVSFRGGGPIARYYVSGALSRDNGILEVPRVSNFNNNIDLRKAQLRSNININLTETTELKLGFNTVFDDYTGPRLSGSEMYVRSLKTSPVLFPPFYEPDEDNQFTQHILFGNNRFREEANAFYFNPYAELVSGYQERTESRMIAQLELSQDLSMITSGLSGKLVANLNRNAFYSISRQYIPFWYRSSLNPRTNEIFLEALNPDQGRETLQDVSSGDTSTSTESKTYFEARLSYIREFEEKHSVTGLLVFTQNERVTSLLEGTSIEASLPFRNRGLAGRFSYGYEDTYFTEFNFGYNGSERFARRERWGFFPSVAIGWVVTNESFWRDNSFVNNLKLKASYGSVGNDNIGSSADRFFYLSRVNAVDVSRGFLTGNEYDNFVSGISVNRYDNDQITWETGDKLNLGIELGLFNTVTIELDVFSETRKNILASRIIPANLGLESPVSANIGKAKGQGIDGTLSYQKSFNADTFIELRGNFTFARNEITKVEEPDYSNTPWRSRVGQSIDQQFGYVAERLFVDLEEVLNSPQQFGEYSGGDIKYKDIDDSGIINSLDQVPIGNPVTPEINYGFGFSMGYKLFDFSLFFQGSANSTFWINSNQSAPFIDDPDVPGISQNQVLLAWANDYWNEQNRNIYARWPRLGAYQNFLNNNTQRNTWFMENGSFLRLKSVELGYNFPDKLVTKVGMNRFRVYLSGINVLTFSSFDLWDPELAGNGLGYPIQQVFNLGLDISI
ncbi:MAG: TonB-dependent receptor [Flavobacteriaceae bacterium]|nr:TonB-dependent receptor [Flavobacteriaceae bacterium]